MGYGAWDGMSGVGILVISVGAMSVAWVAPVVSVRPIGWSNIGPGGLVTEMCGFRV